jgi:hypothetical protein
MKLMIGLLLASLLSPGLLFAGNWTGYLVDSHCYASEERNVNPTDTETSVDRDKDLEIRYCSPNKKTKAFAVVDDGWKELRLDPQGNAKAADLVRAASKKGPLTVTVSGQFAGKNLQVSTLALAK